jgi:hypothetical protein
MATADLETTLEGIDMGSDEPVHLFPINEDTRTPIGNMTLCGKVVDVVDVPAAMPSMEVPVENICGVCLDALKKLGLPL